MGEVAVVSGLGDTAENGDVGFGVSVEDDDEG